VNRRRTLLLAFPGALLPLRASAQAPLGVVRELSGEVTLNDNRVTREHGLQAGQTVRTGANGSISFTIGSDAFFMRPNSALRLEASRMREPVVDLLRLLTGAIGATFARGMRRSIITPTATIGIRGTGVYLEVARDVTYACTCFGATEILTAPSGRMMESVAVAAENHQARMMMTGARIVPAGFERHSNEEIARLEELAGRPNPFRS